jgi:threonine dehydratase
VPSTSPKLKSERIRSLGADVRIVEGYYDEALDASRGRAEETGALVMHAYDQPEVVARARSAPSCPNRSRTPTRCSWPSAAAD